MAEDNAHCSAEWGPITPFGAEPYCSEKNILRKSRILEYSFKISEHGMITPVLTIIYSSTIIDKKNDGIDINKRRTEFDCSLLLRIVVVKKEKKKKEKLHR
ncbi:unnamed protein product [Nezara viridula]|uniref:Uncharacterized protein n=1 Tax=Nezara viridula TaxID=85310 RepID=A0A9P0GX15_NEZVI|nr:unnamed protein product [Nezara viridula]